MYFKKRKKKLGVKQVSYGVSMCLENKFPLFFAFYFCGPHWMQLPPLCHFNSLN